MSDLRACDRPLYGSVPSRVDERARLRQRPGQHFLGSAEFQALLLSRRELERVRQPFARLYGLHDRRSGETYWIEVERWSRPAQS